MQETTLRAGETLFREGEASSHVFFIQHGQLEILKRAGESDILLAVLGKGEILGEMSAIRGEPHSTAAVARSDVGLLALSTQEFLSAFGENDIAMRVLRALCERLAHADRQITSDSLVNGAAGVSEVASIRLLPGGRHTETQIGAEGLPISTLPFIIGRHTGRQHGVRADHYGLMLLAPDSYQLSPKHFAIEERDGKLVLMDLGSQLGTVVNGRRISQFEASRCAPLRLGANDVVAGGLDSPFRFLVRVEEAEGGIRMRGQPRAWRIA